MASDHVAFAELGAQDVDGDLRDAIAADEGVVCVLGVSGAGKSSLIGAVTESLDARYFTLRIPVAAATDAFGSVGAFARHTLEQFRDAKPDALTARHTKIAERALATERTKSKQRAFGIDIGLGAGAPPLAAKLAANFQASAAEELKTKPSDTEVLAALQRTLDVLRSADLLPVLIIEDTDHWASTPAVASDFFDQVVRALSKGLALDMVTIAAVQPVHRNSVGYRAVHELVREVSIPELPDVEAGLIRLLDGRIDRARVEASAFELFDARAISLLGDAYREGMSLRRTLNVARAALEQAVADELSTIRAGHVQQGMAQYPPEESVD